MTASILKQSETITTYTRHPN